MQVMTLIINDAKPVRIAIGSDSDVTIPVQYIILKVPQRIFCRCRHFPAKLGRAFLFGQLNGSLNFGDGLFVFIGLIPNTGFLEDSEVKLDLGGHIVTDEHLHTAIPGVFASGDVRSGATMQIASAVGEGAEAALMIREYLQEKAREE